MKMISRIMELLVKGLGSFKKLTTLDKVQDKKSMPTVLIVNLSVLKLCKMELYTQDNGQME
jgi:hypothetical protein